MVSVADVPVSIGDIISYNFDMYGLSDTLICTIVDITPNCIKIKINNTPEQYWRYHTFKWYYEEWRVNPDYIAELLYYIAPNVPNIKETIRK